MKKQEFCGKTCTVLPRALRQVEEFMSSKVQSTWKSTFSVSVGVWETLIQSTDPALAAVHSDDGSVKSSSRSLPVFASRTSICV